MTRRAWTTVRVTNVADPEAVIAALFAAGAEGVQELPDEVLTHIADADDVAIQAITAAVAGADRAARPIFAPTPDVDWASEWRSRIGAHRVGRLVITPPWMADRFTADERIVIEPAMAFGTGEHETTRGVLRLLSTVIRPGDVVADLGAGSAVLAIAAARLGAARVAAIELDPDAISNAEDNCSRNDVAGRVTVIAGDARVLLPLVAPLRVILANIIWPVLAELLPHMRRALTGDGQVVLSGLLRDERAAIEQHLAVAGWRVERVDEEGLWWSVSIVPC